MSTPGFAFLLLVTCWILYLVHAAIFRLYLSPIARFPGPKLAALTRLYEIYYEVIKGGQFTFKIIELHKEYGPIIRINPWELHIDDPDYYEVLYAGGGKKRDKYSYYCEQFGNPRSMIGTVPHELHRRRRAPLNKLFSKASVAQLQPLIQATVDKLCARLKSFQSSGKPVTISLAFGCLTNDIVCEYSFATSENQVETSDDFQTDIHDALDTVAEWGHVMKQLPWLVILMQKLPRRITALFAKELIPFIDFQMDMVTQIQSIMDDTNQNYKTVSHPTIFHHILESDLSPQEKELSRLAQEGQTIVGAGTETTAWTMSVITYYVLSNPQIKERLLHELKGAMSTGKTTCNQLEQLPYFSAVISEGLRLSHGVSTHLQRVSPDQVLNFKGWEIPLATPVSMTSVLIHLNPSIFPNPNEFMPDRWIENPRLSRYLVSFSKGSRQCLGLNLAYAEMYLCLANFFHTFPDMQLHDTTRNDVEMKADYFLPKASGRGVKVMLK